MNGTFTLTAEGGINLFCRKAVPSEAPKARLVIVHGKGEHSGRYVEFMRFWAENGIAAFAADLRGHGYSGGKTGHTAPTERILDDIDLVCEKSGQLYPEAPLFIYGHSLGGSLALVHRAKRGDAVRGYIISSPWLKLKNPPSPLSVCFVKALSKILPLATIKTNIDPQAISSIPEEQARYLSFELMNGVISLSTLKDVFDRAGFVYETAEETKSRFLLIHGDDDRLIDIEGSRKLAALSKDACEYREFQGSRHEILNDIGAFEAKNKMLEFINSQL